MPHTVPTIAMLGAAALASAQERSPPSTGAIPEVTVTAQKREQSANSIGMAITTLRADELQERGITAVADLPRLVPGFSIQESGFNSTSFTLRGVGFFNSDLGTTPAVTVYVDEAPLPYPAMTRLAAFDLARVEVLKGPQGTLFGQNATGGAVNYIVAKPTDELATGADLSYGRFNRVQVAGFLSGPLSDTLDARISVQARRGDAWQESISRPGDRLGQLRELQGRAILEWHPQQRFTSRLTVTATYDGSDTLAPQFIQPAAAIPALATPGLLTFPTATSTRAADWNPVRFDTGEAYPYASDTSVYHATWRNDLQLSDDVTLTALTSYARLHLAYGQDADGTPFYVTNLIDHAGRISSVFQEVRIAGSAGRVNWLGGVNFAHDVMHDEPQSLFIDNDVGRLFQGFDPQAFADTSRFEGQMHVQTYGVFGRVEYNLDERLMLEGAARYNNDRRSFDNCGIATTDHFARFWNGFRGGAEPLTRVGDCYVVDSSNGLRPVENVHSELDEDSVSWRTGLNWTLRTGLLAYANVSKGYKAGAVPVLAASTVAQFTPVRQESLLAYEAGIKATLRQHRAQLNASVFHYDYRDKQLRGAVLDPTFGPVEALVSIPRSHVNGVETQLLVQIGARLTVDASATYVATRIDRFTGFDARARFGDQSGTPFPFSPKWQSISNLDYEVPLGADLKGFAGASYTYNSSTHAGVGALNTFRIDARGLLDLRAGLSVRDGRYRVWAWGKNVTDEYYWSNVFGNGNAIARFMGQPAAWGVSLAARF